MVSLGNRTCVSRVAPDWDLLNALPTDLPRRCYFDIYVGCGQVVPGKTAFYWTGTLKYFFDVSQTPLSHSKWWWLGRKEQNPKPTQKLRRWKFEKSAQKLKLKSKRRKMSSAWAWARRTMSREFQTRHSYFFSRHKKPLNVIFNNKCLFAKF